VAIIVPIDADVSGLTRKLGSATSSLGGLGKMAGFVAGAAALGGLVATVKVGIDEFMGAEKVTAQTNAVLKSTGGVAKVTADQITDLAGSLMRKSGIDDEAIQSGQNLLLTFTQIRNETGKGNDIFNQATRAMTDLSVAMGQDMKSSAILVGKALNDPIKGVGALSKAGVQFTADQKETIKTMVESGNVMGAQKMILKELETQFGGSAEAAGKTLSGQLNILKQTFNNLAGELVSTFMPAVSRAAQKVVDFLTEFAAAPTLKAKIEVITGTVSDAWQRIKEWWSTGEVKELPSGLKLTPPGKRQVEEAIQQLQRSMDTQLQKAGNALGRTLAVAIFGGTKTTAKEQGKAAGGELVKAFVINMPAIRLGQRFANWVIDGFQQTMSESGERTGGIIQAWVDSMIAAGGGPAYQFGKWLWDKVQQGTEDGANRRVKALNLVPMTKAMKDRIRAAVAEAVQGARQNLQGLGGNVADMVTQIIGAVSPQSAEAKKLREDMKARQDARQEAMLRDAVANAETVEDKKKADDDLQDFLDQKNAERLEKEVADNQEASRRKFNDLVAAFNTGNMDLNDFKAQWQGLMSEYVGGNYGTVLGFAFATSFQQAATAVLSQAELLPAGLAGLAGPSTVSPAEVERDTTREERQKQYERAVGLWEQLRDLRRRRDEAKKGSKERENLQKQINAFRKQHPEIDAERPKRADYGLAKGGIVTGPRYLVGEGEFNEAVIPLGSNTAAEMMRKAFSDAVTGGNQTSYTINVNAGMGVDGVDVGRQIVEAIKVFERRNGPVFAGA